MAVVFSKQDNPYWPLPGDYPSLNSEGMRQARVNAVSLEGRPELEVASWAFFREHYLFPTATTGRGPFYKHGALRSPDMHYKWIYHWEKHQLSVTAAPRSAAKSTLIKENILRKVVSRPHWESVMFLAKQEFITTTFDDFMTQIDSNELILNDFGVLKPSKSQPGIWNHSQIKLRNGAMVTGLPIMGASLGKRPHEIYFDDVEKDDSLVMVPSEHIKGFKSFFFNVVYPMADSFNVRIRVVGTLLSRRTFIFWLNDTKDSRIDDWERVFHSVTFINQDGEVQDEWPEKMGREWQKVQRRRMGPAAYAAQYDNNPVTEAERILRIHPELNTYWTEDKDGAYDADPLNSQAKMVSHQLHGWDKEAEGLDLTKEEPVPIPRPIVRPFGESVSNMRRFITIDWAPTVSETSDFSCIHVMGIENSKDYRDTLWSLDLWLDKKPTEEVIRRAYLMALKWQVPLVAVEAYPVQMEFAERLQHDLPSMYGEGEVPCRVLPIKFPTAYKKPDKIAGLHWRFKQYRMKLPLDLSQEEPYRSLWYQVENFTEDLALLRHDDAIDTLAMHLAIGKPTAPSGPDLHITKDPIQMLKEGEYQYESGIGVMSGINAADIPNEVLEEMFQKRWEEANEDDYEPEPDWINYA
jgi:hypothetical protein